MRRSSTFAFFCGFMAGAFFLFPLSSFSAELIPKEAFTGPTTAVGGEDSPAPLIGKDTDGAPVLRLPCPFSTLTNWRVYWDIPVELDLKSYSKFKLMVRVDGEESVGVLLIHFKTGSSWFNAELIGVGKEWRVLTIPRNKFNTEGDSARASWEKIDRIRISATPGAKKDTVLLVKSIDASTGISLDEFWKVGPWDAQQTIEENLGANPVSKPYLEEAQRLFRRAGTFSDLAAKEPQELLKEARGNLVLGYAKILKPVAGETRGAWIHSGTAYGMGWDKAAQVMQDNGLNAVFPNVLWSGAAYYPSKVVPVAGEVAVKGDQLKECIDACHARGIKVHAWKVCWQFGWMNENAAIPFRFAGRTQISQEGKQADWLCPSNKENRKYELGAIMEMVKKYDIDGVHLDYIRYQNDNYCFCGTCRRNFEAGLGKKVKNWPADVMTGGKYGQKYAAWRRDVITSFVREVRRSIRKVKPKVKLSAAVFAAPEGVFQDWPSWVKEGLLDFVCPMNYTEDPQEHKNLLKKELEWVKGKVPVLSGIYCEKASEFDQSPDTVLAQVQAARDLGANGFVLFELDDSTAKEVLPLLHQGLTAEK